MLIVFVSFFRFICRGDGVCSGDLGCKGLVMAGWLKQVLRDVAMMGGRG